MNTRPISIASLGAILFVVAVYFGGQHVLERSRVTPKEKSTITHTQEPTRAVSPEQIADAPTLRAVSPEQTATVTVDNTPVNRDSDVSAQQDSPEVSNRESLDTPLASDFRNSPEFLEYRKLLSAIDELGDYPRRPDFQTELDYMYALQAHLNAVKPFRERLMELDKQYLQSLSQEKFNEFTTRLRKELKEEEPGITDAEIDEEIKELEELRQ